MGEKILKSVYEGEALLLISQLRLDKYKLKKALRRSTKKNEELQVQVDSLSRHLSDLRRDKNHVLADNQKLMQELWEGISRRDKMIKKLRQQATGSFAALQKLSEESQRTKEVHQIFCTHFPSVEALKGRTDRLVNGLVKLASGLIELYQTSRAPMLDTMETSNMLRSDIFYSNCSLYCNEKVMFESFLDDSVSFIKTNS